MWAGHGQKHLISTSSKIKIKINNNKRKQNKMKQSLLKASNILTEIKTQHVYIDLAMKT